MSLLHLFAPPVVARPIDLDTDGFIDCRGEWHPLPGYFIENVGDRT